MRCSINKCETLWIPLKYPVYISMNHSLLYHSSFEHRGVHIDGIMSSRVRRQAPILKVLANAHPHVCRSILKGADKDLLHCLSECAYNILQGNVHLTPNQKASLTKYKQKIRQVANKRTALKQKQKIVQTGGFLPALLAPLLTSVIAPLAGEAVKGIAKAIRKKKKHGKSNASRRS